MLDMAKMTRCSSRPSLAAWPAAPPATAAGWRPSALPGETIEATVPQGGWLVV